MTDEVDEYGAPVKTAVDLVKEETRQARQERIKNAWAWLMAHSEGRAVIADILDRGNLKSSVYVRGDVYHTLAQIGRREYMVELRDDVAARFPDATRLMDKENG